MQHRNTGETPGGIINKQWLHSDKYYLKEVDQSSIVLSPGGYLICILATVDHYTGDNVKCQVVKSDWHSATGSYVSRQDLIGEFEIQSAYGFYEGGILLDEPMVNVDTRTPYILKISTPHPGMTITSINAWFHNQNWVPDAPAS